MNFEILASKIGGQFSRYLLGTLQSKIYQNSNSNSFSIDKYRNYCLEKELNFLKAGGFGGKWKNSSTEKMFIKVLRREN